MIHKLFFEKKLAFVLLFLFFSTFTFGVQNYSRQDVSKVLKAIEKVEKDTARQTKRSLKKISITESELNSYIAYLVEIKNEKFMKELKVKLFKKNKVEGIVLIDLRGEKVPGFLRPQMTLYFGGKLETKEGLVRFLMKDLFLEEQRIDPNVLDFIITFAAKIGNFEAWSINDWWELPHGIRDVETENHKAVFFY
jgi:hypothetical protein